MMATVSKPESKEQVRARREPAFPILELQGGFFNTLPYIPGPVVSKGMSGFVVLATSRDKPGDRIAVKVMPLKGKNSEAIQRLLFNREINTFYNTDHPSLAKCLFAAHSPDVLAIAMKFYPLGDLNCCLSILPSAARPWVVGRLCEAVAYLHHKRIVHGDIKLENVLMDEGFAPVLADFGLSRYIPEDVLSLPANKFGGTPDYWSPEIRGRDSKVFVDPFKVDIYALGVAIFSVLSQIPLFPGADYLQMVKICTEIPQCHRSILERMLEPDFKQRCTSLEVMSFYSDLVRQLFPLQESRWLSGLQR